MTKFLVFNTPQYGHVNPTLAVVQELIARGEEVVYYLTDEFKQVIEATGATFKPYTSIVTSAWALKPATGQYKNPFIGMAYETIEECDYVISQIREDVYAQEADYILYDSVLGKIFSLMLKLPAIQFRPTYAFNQHFNLLEAQFQSLATGEFAEAFMAVNRVFEEFCTSYQLPPLPFSSLLTRVEPVNIVFLPRIFQPFRETFDKYFYFVGPSILPRFANTDFPLEKLQPKPTIYISLGTIFSNQIEFVRSCFQAFGNSSWQVVQSIGKQMDKTALEPIPENFLVAQHVPQIDVLQHSTIFITHGGMNSVMEALYYGVPLIIVPQMPEQYLTAQKIAELGLGLQISKQDVTADGLQAAVAQISTEKAFQKNAQHMQSIVRDAGGYKEAANSITYFTSRKTRE